MVKRTSNIEQILGNSLPGADRFLADAIGTTDPATEVLLVDALIERNRPDAMRRLILRFDQLGDGAAKRVILAAGKLNAALRDAAGLHDARGNVVEIIASANAAELAYLLADVLRSPDASSHRQAAAALLRMAKRLHRTGPNDQPKLPRRHRYLLRATCEAVGAFGVHRRRDVLLAGFAFSPLQHTPLSRVMADRRSPAFPVVCELLGQPPHPLVARALLHYAGNDLTRPSVRRAFARPREGERVVPPALQLAHLLINPEVRSTVRGVEPCAHLTLAGTPMDPQTARAAARWIDTLPLDLGRRVSALSALSANPDRLARLAALRSLAKLREGGADEAIGALCFDPEPVIARTALRHLMRREWPGLAKLMVRLIGSPHDDVRGFAERHLAPLGFERFWANWPRMSKEQRTLAGRALMRIDQRFCAKLAEKMTAADSDDRHRAVQMARHLDQQTYFEKQLTAAVHDDDARVVASAVMGLSRLADSPDAEGAIRAALDHDDDRVRSNAVEALEQVNRLQPVVDKIGRLMSGRGNRSRATAIKALMAMPRDEAMPALRRMLEDGNEDHRVSALWVVEHQNVVPLLEVVGRLAKGDASQRVRRRAVRAIRAMAARARHDDRRAG